MSGRRSTAVTTLTEALALGTPPPDNLAVPVFRHGSLEVEWYAPGRTDPQTPHDRDEVYVVARGRATFFDGTARRPVTAGDFIFVAARCYHRFEDLSADFGTWVLFYGPVGGEAAQAT